MIIKDFAKMKNVITVFVLFSVSVVIISILFTFSLNTPKVSADSTAIDKTETQINFMEEVIGEYPTYFDAHLELSRLYLLQGDIGKARESLNAAKKIDPNSKSIKNYEEILSSLN